MSHPNDDRIPRSLSKIPIPLTYLPNLQCIQGIDSESYRLISKLLYEDALQSGASTVPVMDLSDGDFDDTSDDASTHQFDQEEADADPSYDPMDGNPSEKRVRKPRAKQPYVPKPASASAAILIACYVYSREQERNGGNVWLSKRDLMSRARHYTSVAMAPSTESMYGGWASVTQHIRKGLMTAQGNPRRYQLTQEGMLPAVLAYMAYKQREGVVEGSEYCGGEEDLARRLRSEWELRNPEILVRETKTKARNQSINSGGSAPPRNGAVLGAGAGGSISLGDLSDNDIVEKALYANLQARTKRKLQDASTNTKKAAKVSNGDILSNRNIVTSTNIIDDSVDVDPYNAFAPSLARHSQATLAERLREPSVQMTSSSSSSLSSSSASSSSYASLAPTRTAARTASNTSSTLMDTTLTMSASNSRTVTAPITSSSLVASSASAALAPDLASAALDALSPLRGASLRGASSPTTQLQSRHPFSNACRCHLCEIPPSAVRFIPSEYEIGIAVDNREMYQGVARTDEAKVHFSSLLMEQDGGMLCFSGALAVGDMLWVARRRSTGELFVLDCVIERKRTSDLIDSIKDGRYREQRLRLLRTGLSRVCYIIEGPLKGVDALPLVARGVDVSHKVDSSAVLTAICGLQGVAGFLVQHTLGSEDTRGFLTRLHSFICDYYNNMEYKKYTRPCFTTGARIHHSRNMGEDSRGPADGASVYYEDLYFGPGIQGAGEPLADFQIRMKKTKSENAAAMFAKQLKQVKGVSANAAAAIADKYQSFATLLSKYLSIGVGTDRAYALLTEVDIPGEKKVGVAASRRIHDAFCGQPEGAAAVDGLSDGEDED